LGKGKQKALKNGMPFFEKGSKGTLDHHLHFEQWRKKV